MDIGTTLLEYGADTNAVTRQGISPVHLAAQEGSVDLVSLLLTKNANVNIGNKVKHTLCIHGQTDIQHTYSTLYYIHINTHTQQTHILTWPHRMVTYVEITFLQLNTHRSQDPSVPWTHTHSYRTLLFTYTQAQQDGANRHGRPVSSS